MDDRRASGPSPSSPGRRAFLGTAGGLVLAGLAGCAATEKPKGTLIEGDDSGDGEGDGDSDEATRTTTTEPGTPTPDEVFSIVESSFEPNDEGRLAYAATIENVSDARWAATLHATLKLGNPVQPEAEGSATPTTFTPREIDLTRRIDLAPGATTDVTMTFDVTWSVYNDRYRSSSFRPSWSDLSRPSG